MFMAWSIADPTMNQKVAWNGLSAQFSVVMSVISCPSLDLDLKLKACVTSYCMNHSATPSDLSFLLFLIRWLPLGCLTSNVYIFSLVIHDTWLRRSAHGSEHKDYFIRGMRATAFCCLFHYSPFISDVIVRPVFWIKSSQLTGGKCSSICC